MNFSVAHVIQILTLLYGDYQTFEKGDVTAAPVVDVNGRAVTFSAQKNGVDGFAIKVVVAPTHA